MKRLVLFLLVLLVVAIPLTTALAQTDKENTIIVRSIGNVTTLNHLFITDGASNQAVGLILPLPFDVDRFSGLPIPGLTTWEISEDSLTYTFHIREDAVWSDGTPITSADAKFTYDAAARPEIESVRASNVARFESVNIIDDKTYEVKLNSVNCAVFLDFNSIRWLPSHKFAADFSDVTTNPFNQFADVSGGPYILDEILPDEFQRYHANPTYWGGEPKIPFWINKIITDPAIYVQALVAGELDYAAMSGAEVQQIPDTENLDIQSFPVNSVGLFIMNHADPSNPMPAYDEDGNLNEQPPHPIFADLRVRQAVVMGYNKDDILGTLGDGGGTRLVSSVVPAITWAFNADLEPWPYDPEASAALLEEAGWVDQDGDGIRECHGCMYAEEGTPLSFKISYSPLIEYFETTALVAQDQLSQLGMDVQIESLEWAAYLNDVLLAQTFDASVVSWGGGSPPDPTSTEPMMLSTNDKPGAFNVSSYVNLEMDELMQQGRTVPGCAYEDRVPIYNQVQQIQRDDVAMEFTVSPNTFHVMNRRISYEPGPWWIVYSNPQEFGFTAP